MFSGAGVGEALLEDKGIHCIVANEIEPERARLYSHLYPKTKMICGDICSKNNYEKFTQEAVEGGVELLIATPPCQGFSLSGKNKSQEEMVKDARNFLIYKVFDVIDNLNPNYVLIENVTRFLSLKYPHMGGFRSVVELIREKYGANYNIDWKIVNAKDFGVPQSRKRAFIKIYRKNLVWPWPESQNEIVTVRDVIGWLPSIESGEVSKFKWHYGRKHTPDHIKWMRHTPTGESAFSNIEHYPRNRDGKRTRGYHDAYSRMDWDKPAPTITIRSDAISSNKKVHPGRLLPDGTYSDARVLSILELMILSTLPKDWDIPNWASEILIRKVIGEAVPPLLLSKILEGIQ